MTTAIVLVIPAERPLHAKERGKKAFNPERSVQTPKALVHHLRMKQNTPPCPQASFSPRTIFASMGILLNSPTAKSSVSKVTKPSSARVRCLAPDLIPDDIYYINFDCTRLPRDELRSSILSHAHEAQEEKKKAA